MYFIIMYADLEDCENDKSFVGWFKSRAKAMNCVNNNTCDLNEAGVYEYARISFIPEGIYMPPEEDIWFKFNPDSKRYEAWKALVLGSDGLALLKRE